MRSVLAALAVLAAASAAFAQPAPRSAPVAASSGFDAWVDICARPQARVQEALAAAEARGFNPFPQAMIPQLPPMMRSAQVRMKTDAAAMSLVMVGDGVIPVGQQQMTMDFCAVGVQPGDFDALRGEAAAWARVTPEATMSQAGRVSYVFAEDSRGRRAIARGDREAGVAAIQSGTLRFVFLEQRGPMTLIMYGVPRMPGRRAAASVPSVSSAAR